MNTELYSEHQRKLLNLFLDGNQHHLMEIRRHLDPTELDSMNVIRNSIFRLNKAMKSNDEGWKVVCISRGKYNVYQLVRPFKPE